MRAIDEIEDHPNLSVGNKARMLRSVSHILQTPFESSDFQNAFKGFESTLPDVTLRLGEWAELAPRDIAPRIWETFASMAERMAQWAEQNWLIQTKRDLDEYTYAVAGVLVLLLSDLWCWFDHTHTNRAHAISYGRTLQATNILIDRVIDEGRGVDFWPKGWKLSQMLAYVKDELQPAHAYVETLPQICPARDFCEQPLRNACCAIEQLGLELDR